MTNVPKGKKPPINLLALEEEINTSSKTGESEKPEHEPGELGYLKAGPRSGDMNTFEGRDWWGLVTTLIIAMVISGALLLGLTPSKKDIRTLQANEEVLEERVGVLETPVGAAGDLLTKVNTAVEEARSAKMALAGYVRKGEVSAPDLSGYALKSDLITMDLLEYVKVSELDSLRGVVSSLQAQVRTLEVEEEEVLAVAAYEDVRWTTLTSFKHALSDAHKYLEVEVTPFRVGPGEDYYELRLIFANTGATTIVNAHPVVLIVLTPRDDVVVDRGAPSLVTDTYPYPYWDTDVVTRSRRGVEVTRQIAFESEQNAFVINLEPGRTLVFDLELELFYK